jgi:hypothetical protein
VKRERDREIVSAANNQQGFRDDEEEDQDQGEKGQGHIPNLSLLIVNVMQNRFFILLIHVIHVTI